MTSKDFYKELLDNLSTALLVLEPDLRLSFISPAAQALLELSESRGLGHNMEELFQGQEALQEGLQAAVQSQGANTNRGISLKLPSGKELTVDCTVSPFPAADQAETRLILELQPMDRIRRINRDEGLMSSHETTQAMVRGLAHEIKNPLGGLRGAAQLLARELPDPALEEYTRIIIEESDRLRDLVDRLLGPHQKPQFARLNIHEVLEHIHTLLQAEAGNEVTLHRDYDPSVPELIADRAQLIQAVLNIVRNALLATADNEGERLITLRSRVQRQFTIGTRRHRLVCRVDIEDNGPGIPDELIDSIFIPMVSGRADGSGLGLAISQSIINQHRGLIECRSEPGRTEFSLYLPLEVEHA
jgi:two-component system nitrogen regulation sensor histidine kinase GlnL